jgi:hypothetical protein
MLLTITNKEILSMLNHPKLHSTILFATCAATLMLSGCGGSSNDDSSYGSNDTPDSIDAPPPPNNDTSTLGDGNVSPTLADIQSKVLDKNCATSGCHAGASAPQGLLMDADHAFDLLVNQPSQGNPQALLIKPGDPENSYIVQKLEGTASVGAQMPLNASPLSVETIQAIKTWIQNGALGPRLSSIQANIFTPNCIECHSGESPSGGLNLEEGKSYASLVEIKRRDNPEIRVVAGNSGSSFLINKLENTNLGENGGKQMPLGKQPLDKEVIDVIRQWIDAGALDN